VVNVINVVNGINEGDGPNPQKLAAVVNSLFKGCAIALLLPKCPAINFKT
jgi:hypothetical protein